MMRTPAWLRHFGLKDAPFSKDLDDKDLWLPTSRQGAVEQLVESLAERQHAVVVGEPGVGKTCTRRALRARLPESGFRLTYCHNATLGRRDFYRQLCLALGLPVKATAAAVFWALNHHVQELARDRVHPVFLLDEAQLMRDDVLQHLHILSNYSWDQKPLLSIVLVGLPDLWRRLSLGIHRSLFSRIHCRLALEQARPEDTVEYVAYRLERVGGKPAIFASDALALLHEATAGQLRDIDRLATACLRAAGRKKLKHVDVELLQDVLDADTLLD
jgi:type II secretory pathway predicted ATPase ExeA